ncbi:outer membrane lipoprotein carrier protein LolA [Halorutilales archaeon Cl-col2-1]
MDKRESPTDTDTDDAADDAESRGITDSFGLLAIALLVIGVVGAGLTIAQTPMGDNTDTRDAETVTADGVLEGVHERYNSSETLAGNATVEVSKEDETRSYSVSFAVADENESRVSVDSENRSAVLGSNGSAVWLHSEKEGVTRVYSRDEIRDAKEGDIEPFGFGRQPFDHNHSRDGEYEHLWGSVDANETNPKPWDIDAVHDHGYDHSQASNHTINTTSEYVGRQSLRGTEAHVVEITLRDENQSRHPETLVTYWVSNDDVVLRQEVETPNATVTVDVTQTRFNVSIADSTFEPPTGEDTTQFATSTFDSFDGLQDSTDFELLRLGSNYSFDEGRKVVYAGETAAVQEYVDDGSRLRVVSAEDTSRSFGFADRHTSTSVNKTSTQETEVVIDGVNTTVTVSETSRGAAVSWTHETDGDELRHAVVSETESAETVLEVVEKIG